MAAKDRIGFIGVGFMGHGMAKNLLEKGFPLTLMGNRNRAPVDALVAMGATEVKTPAEVAKASDKDQAHCRATCCGDPGSGCPPIPQPSH